MPAHSFRSLNTLAARVTVKPSCDSRVMVRANNIIPMITSQQIFNTKILLLLNRPLSLICGGQLMPWNVQVCSRCALLSGKGATRNYAILGI